MPISGAIYPFIYQSISFAPQKNGVYALYDGSVTIYIGSASGNNTIRYRLQCHQQGDKGSCTQNASHFKCEVTSEPLTRKKELLKEYKNKYGKLPRCNY